MIAKDVKKRCQGEEKLLICESLDPKLRIPGTEGWEKMYPPSLIMPKEPERRKELKGLTYNNIKMLWPGVIKPLIAAVGYSALVSKA